MQLILNYLRKRLPQSLLMRGEVVKLFAPNLLSKWIKILNKQRSISSPKGSIRVSYGVDSLPKKTGIGHGGIIKFQRLAEEFPHSARSFHLLYMVSSRLPMDWKILKTIAKMKGRKLVWNQNGISYPAWQKTTWKLTNAPMREMLLESDYVVYQSKFCKMCADKFVAKRNQNCEILYNCVDTNVFIPRIKSLKKASVSLKSRLESREKLQIRSRFSNRVFKENYVMSLAPVGQEIGGNFNESFEDNERQISQTRPLILLLGGNQMEKYRVWQALKTVYYLKKEGIDVKLRISGKLGWTEEKEARREYDFFVRQLEIEREVELIGNFTQNEAPFIYQSADILLHTKFQDPSPGIINEALSCGLPVVYSKSGGVPELVGNKAGIGIDAPIDFEKMHPPCPKELSEAVIRVQENLADYSKAARKRAEDKFGLKNWKKRHLEIFTSLFN